MYLELEALAQKLLDSGLLRIAADDRCNFVHYSRPYESISMMFSQREIREPELVKKTRAIIRQRLAMHHKFAEMSRSGLEKIVEEDFARLLALDEKNIPLEDGHDIRLARLLVQSTHSAVTSLLIAEGVEVFVSFSHNIGDMLNMRQWQKAGNNNGMQSTQGEDCAIYVSCGGNPFFTGDAKRHSGDGEAAMARMMIIAAQEMGHYADIKRDHEGRHVGRFSADSNMRHPSAEVKRARLLDIHNVSKVVEKLDHEMLQQMKEAERQIKFYEKYQVSSGKIKALTKQAQMLRQRFVKQARQRGYGFLAQLPQQERYGSHVGMMLSDMKENLSPYAAAYLDDDPDAEEAVACAEALARVPQQVIKWGHAVTKAMMPNLYLIYYGQVTPACIAAYEAISGQKYQMRFTKPKNRASTWFKKWFGKKA